MKLRLVGHKNRYAMEQLQMALFPDDKMEYTEAAFSGDGAISALSQGQLWVTATARITRGGETRFGIAVAAAGVPRSLYTGRSYRKAITRLLCLFYRNRPPGARCPEYALPS